MVHRTVRRFCEIRAMAKDAYIYGKVKEADVIRFLDSVLQLAGHLTNSPVAPKTTTNLGSSAFKNLSFLIGASPGAALSLSELHGQIQVNDVPLPVSQENEVMAEAFIFFILEHNLRKITFEKDVGLNDFMNRSLLLTLNL